MRGWGGGKFTALYVTDLFQVDVTCWLLMAPAGNCEAKCTCSVEIGDWFLNHEDAPVYSALFMCKFVVKNRCSFVPFMPDLATYCLFPFPITQIALNEGDLWTSLCSNKIWGNVKFQRMYHEKFFEQCHDHSLWGMKSQGDLFGG